MIDTPYSYEGFISENVLTLCTHIHTRKPRYVLGVSLVCVFNLDKHPPDAI